jgi:formylglycine-generating enzyme required for sulfatase activity
LHPTSQGGPADPLPSRVAINPVPENIIIGWCEETLANLNARLSTEAQWEYACRAGTTTPFSFGKNITPEQVNYNGEHPYVGCKKGLFRGETVPVKSLPANPWGLFEVHGNVWEWCSDWFVGDYPTESVVDPEGPP